MQKVYLKTIASRMLFWNVLEAFEQSLHWGIIDIMASILSLLKVKIETQKMTSPVRSPRSQSKCCCLLAVWAFKKCTLSGGEGKHSMNFSAPLLTLHLNQLLLQVLLRPMQVQLMVFMSRKKQISQKRRVALGASKALGCSPRVR